MSVKTDNGFTVIEVMLFLGVTGLLAIGVLAGSGVAIGQQRYRDSVNTFKSFLQEQYSESANVVNARTGEWNCGSNARVNEQANGGEARGTSDCVLLGRFISINETGKELRAANVTAYRVQGAEEANNDIEEIAENYRLAQSPVELEESEVNWGATIVRPKSTNPQPISMLIVRSPLSGATLTFTAPGNTTNLNELVTQQNLATERNLCVDPDGTPFVGERLAVRIAPYAASQSAISIPTEGEGVCD